MDIQSECIITDAVIYLSRNKPSFTRPYIYPCLHDITNSICQDILQCVTECAIVLWANDAHECKALKVCLSIHGR